MQVTTFKCPTSGHRPPLYGEYKGSDRQCELAKVTYFMRKNVVSALIIID